MGMLKRNRAFLLTAGLIVMVGAALFCSVVAVRVVAAESTATPTTPASTNSLVAYNTVSSYGMEGYSPLTIQPTADTPTFIKNRIKQKRGIVLFVYCNGASDDMDMLQSFNEVKSEYAADSSFFSFDAVESKDLGDTLQQLHVSDPPVLAIITSDGKVGQVSQLYTGWVGKKVIEQAVADAVRGL